jgi:hypothetical protein
MGRTYAGVLGLVAFATVVARGVIHQSGASATFPLAERAIAEDLKGRFQAELAKIQAEATTATTETK